MNGLTNVCFEEPQAMQPGLCTGMSIYEVPRELTILSTIPETIINREGPPLDPKNRAVFSSPSCQWLYTTRPRLSVFFWLEPRGTLSFSDALHSLQ